MNEQAGYDSFFKNTSADLLDRYCNGDMMDIYEKSVLKLMIKPKKLIDIGCGSGNRLFPFYQKLGIDFVGVEKFQNFINGSYLPEKIIALNLSAANFIDDLKQQLKERDHIDYDTIVLFGGVINGLIDPVQRKSAWKNLSSLIGPRTSLFIHSICDSRWYDHEGVGKSYRFVTDDEFPNQYIYTHKELKQIFTENNLLLTHSYSFDYPTTTIKHAFFLLKKKRSK